jgi:hypothetical protein
LDAVQPASPGIRWMRDGTQTLVRPGETRARTQSNASDRYGFTLRTRPTASPSALNSLLIAGSRRSDATAARTFASSARPPAGTRGRALRSFS